ncbi:Zinc/cadmium resistance protein [Nymphon striatum]|nr:Zinc/cadmium resistance protein [Nymphon striatum]
MGKYSGKRCRLLSMFSLTAGFFLVEIVVGYITNSMALVADSFHMLSDVAALIIAFLSVKMSPKKWSKNTFGWARAEVLGALVNSVFLVALCFSIFVESMKRFYEVEPINNPVLILIVGTLGLLVNVIGLFLFHEHGSSHGHSHGARHRNLPTLDQVITEDMNLGEINLSTMNSDSQTTKKQDIESSSQMNMRGVFLHVMADAVGSIIVMISALVIWKTDFTYKYYVDPALSVIMVFLILRSVWPLLVDSALILLQTVPTHIQVDDIQKKLLRQDIRYAKSAGMYLQQMETSEQTMPQFAGVRTGTSEQHNDMRLSNQSRYNKDCGIFVGWFQVHPQFVGYDTDCLVSLSTGIVADTSVDCDNAVELGLKAASEMA